MSLTFPRLCNPNVTTLLSDIQEAYEDVASALESPNFHVYTVLSVFRSLFRRLNSLFRREPYSANISRIRCNVI